MRNSIAILALAGGLALVGEAGGGSRGADELFWVPSFEQALDQADHTGRPIFMMFYTLVGKGAVTYSGEGTVCRPGFAHEETRVVSHPEVQKRLARFVCVRLDWEPMMKAKEKYGLRVPTQGNQVLLDPRGKYIPGIDPAGKRYAIADFVELLDKVQKDYPAKAESKDDLRLDWFLLRPTPQGAGSQEGAFLAKLERKPVLTIAGTPPDWVKKQDFLERHLRQFVWRQVPTPGPARITVTQHEPARKELAIISLEDAKADEVGRQLDAAWLEYMKVRPMLARGYIDNPHGNWLKNVMEKAHAEELEVRDLAEKGLLRPPGREGR